MRYLLPVLAVLAGCATTTRPAAAAGTRAPAREAAPARELPADAPVAEVPALLPEAEQPQALEPLPTVPVKNCQPVMWATIIAAGVTGGAGCFAGPCADTLNPNPDGPPPQSIRNVKALAQGAAAVLTPVSVWLISILSRCSEP